MSLLLRMSARSIATRGSEECSNKVRLIVAALTSSASHARCYNSQSKVTFFGRIFHDHRGRPAMAKGKCAIVAVTKSRYCYAMRRNNFYGDESLHSGHREVRYLLHALDLLQWRCRLKGFRRRSYSFIVMTSC